MAAAKLAQRPVLRKVARRQHPEGNVLFQLPRHLPRREGAGGIRVDQHLHNHLRIVGRVATPVPLVRRVERTQIQGVQPGHSHGAPSALPEPTLEDPAGAAASGPAGTAGMSSPLTPLGEPQTVQNAFGIPQDSGRGFLRRRLLVNTRTAGLRQGRRPNGARGSRPLLVRGPSYQCRSQSRSSGRGGGESGTSPRPISSRIRRALVDVATPERKR